MQNVIELSVTSLLSIFIMTTLLNTLHISWGVVVIPEGLDRVLIPLFVLYGSIKLAELIIKPIKWLWFNSKK
ncbi:hypothetical protein D4100_01170 [Serratia inhibens]|uniref:Uncharacterized protein n=1 Tax=Serratia inhibens TaxID=2338073 RepID=A0AA92X858_9GAMM|nr:hypothetical protein D4100_01170 [Serratia inhibens]